MNPNQAKSIRINKIFGLEGALCDSLTPYHARRIHTFTHTSAALHARAHTHTHHTYILNNALWLSTREPNCRFTVAWLVVVVVVAANGGGVLLSLIKFLLQCSLSSTQFLLSHFDSNWYSQQQQRCESILRNCVILCVNLRFGRA